MTNKKKGTLTIVFSLLLSVEQFISTLYFDGKLFSQPIDPIFLLQMVCTIYGIQLILTPKADTQEFKSFVKFAIISLIMGIIGIGIKELSNTLAPIKPEEPTSMTLIAMHAVMDSLASFAWCASMFGAFVALRNAWKDL